MATFTPPTIQDVPPVSDYEPEIARNRVGYNLRRHYVQMVRGINVFKLTDGTYIASDPVPGIAGPGEPYPATLESLVPNDALAQSWYNGVMTNFPLTQPVAIVYYGGHSYTVTAAEATALTNAGYGPYLS